MGRIASRIWNSIWFVLQGLGTAFLLAGAMMFAFRVGRSPLLAMMIGLGILALSNLVERKLPKCPRCGSLIVENGRCGVCDQKVED
jgi:hypothetical protein